MARHERHVRVRASEFSPERLDTGFYARAYFDTREAIRGSGLTIESVGNVCEPWQFGAYALCNHIEWSDAASGIPYLKAEALGSPLLNEAGLAYVTRATHRLLEKSQLKPGDIVVSTSGTIGLCAVLPERLTQANSNQDTIKFNPSSAGYDCHFVAAWIASAPGQVFLNREAGGAVQQHVYLYNFKRLPLLKIAAEAQRYIGDKVRQAERLRERARRLDTLIFAAFDPLTQSLPIPQRAFRVPSSEVEAYRLNPNHFDPVVRAAIHAAKAVARLHPLSDLVVDGDIAGGATPLGAQYVADGIFFARVQNVKPLRLDRSDAAFITEEQDREIVRSRCRTDDVVLSITGYPGTASVVLAEDLPLNINQHSVRFAIRSEFGAGYVAAAINSRFGQLQVGRLAVGGTRDALDYASVRSLLIPELSSETREAISSQVRIANLCVRAAQRVVALAKLLVEHLIDGRVNEADLVAAQKALEAGDRSAEREILKGIRQSDAPDAKPLIADVDSLYALLNGPDGQEA